MRLHILVALNLWIALNYLLASVVFAAALRGVLTMLGVTDWSRRILWMGTVGTALFLAGCAIHHAHLALHLASDRMFFHMLVIDGAQAVGGPMFLAAALAGWRASRRTVPPLR